MRDDFDVARVDESREHVHAGVTYSPACCRRSATKPVNGARTASALQVQQRAVARYARLFQLLLAPWRAGTSLRRADSSKRCCCGASDCKRSLCAVEQPHVGLEPLHRGFVVAHGELQPLVVDARDDFVLCTARPGSAIHSSVPLTSVERRASLRLAIVPVAVSVGAKDCCLPARRRPERHGRRLGRRGAMPGTGSTARARRSAGTSVSVLMRAFLVQRAIGCIVLRQQLRAQSAAAAPAAGQA